MMNESIHVGQTPPAERPCVISPADNPPIVQMLYLGIITLCASRPNGIFKYRKIIGTHPVVRIQISGPFPGRGTQSLVSGSADTLMAASQILQASASHFGAVTFFQQHIRSVGRTVVNDNQFKIGIILHQDGINGFTNAESAVKRRHND